MLLLDRIMKREVRPLALCECVVCACVLEGICIDVLLSSHVWGSLRPNHPGSSGSGLRLSNRGRIWLRRRGGARGLIARWPIIPASEVPDELVDQAMSVLQDKSRDMVIRELQRTVS